MKRTYLILFLLVCSFFSSFAKGILYVQSPKAKLLASPQLTADGLPLSMGESLTQTSEQGLFVQVRNNDKIGWVSKLFVSPLPPSEKIKLGTASNSSEAVLARQRASDFTKTAAARGLSETEKLRVRGGAELYDFESLRWLESLRIENITVTKRTENSLPTSFSRSVSTDTEQEVKVGRALAARLIQKYGLVKEEELTKYLNRVGTKIANNSSRGDLNFRFGILDSDEINAFACPGGFIFLTKAGLRQISSESELAGVLSHEIGHVVLFHNGSFEKMNVFLEIITGMLGPSGGEVISAATSATLGELEKQFFETGRDISFEWEADEAGAILAAQSGYPAGGLGNYLSRLSKAPNAKQLTHTHPDTTTRVTKLAKIESTTVSNKDASAEKEEWSQYIKLIP
ncbi:M48 family metalloprotease [Leptospira ilyithenensis]|uniref:Peptidase M48 n=1 Tax=Leptospira ilyithenensis TaxID=2484901 RepID=A0A4R9LVA0_9LEPT|nr:M48 family metalloprotease [Leptospira ilyithenensis]TGN14510.1 peptidase M48 [Leptospira ilyithenensis]